MEMRHDSDGEALKCVSQNLSMLTRRTIDRSGNGSSVDEVAHAWERKFVYFSVHAQFAMCAMLSETKHYTTIDKILKQNKQIDL